MSSFPTCPACSYTRQPADHAPDWQCPKCQKAYVKTAMILRKEETREIRAAASDGPPELAPPLVPEAKKARRLLAGFVTAVVVGSSLFILFQVTGKRADPPPEPAAIPDVSLAAPTDTARGHYAFIVGSEDRRKNDRERWALKSVAATQQAQDQWKIDSERWVQRSVVTAQHTEGTAGLGLTAAAQSFIPHGDTIRAIQVGLYPTGERGWIRFEIMDDMHGAPGWALGTSWLFVDAECPVPHGEYMIVPFADIAVNPKGTYWFTIAEFRDPGRASRHLTNLKVATSDTYREGELILPSKYALQGLFDANFRIISGYNSLPGLRAASDAEMRSLPSDEDLESVRQLWYPGTSR